MGCKQSRTAPVHVQVREAPAAAGGPSRPKCAREGCNFARHTDQPHGFCCNLCRANGQHGPLCQKHTWPIAPPPDDRFKLSWHPSLLFGKGATGMKDFADLSATETMHIVAHKGELFASFGKWMSPDFQKRPCKNFVGRLSSSDGQWEVDMRCQGSSEHAVRFACLKSITWTRDCRGHELTPAVEQLTLCYSLGAHGNIIMFRDDNDQNAPGTQYKWSETNYTGKITDPTASDSARAVIVHRDAVTGVDRIFALHGMRGALSGHYDADSKTPGHVVWDKDPEKVDLSAVKGGATKLEFRPLAFVRANGKLYMSAASVILQRVDGHNPVWKVVTDIAKFRSDGKFHEAVGGIRGLTAVPCPSNPKQDSILCCWNPNSQSHSWILRMDPSDDGNLKPPVEESSIRKLAKAYLGTEDLHYSIGAYNDMLPTTFGTQRCHLIGFQICLGGSAKGAGPDPGQKNYWAGGGFAVRVAHNDYYVLEVGGRGSKSHRPLTAVRCYANSPFKDEAGTVYFGGYDCNSSPSNNTAWIYKGIA
eukprot:s2228_g7.t1